MGKIVVKVQIKCREVETSSFYNICSFKFMWQFNEKMNFMYGNLEDISV